MFILWTWESLSWCLIWSTFFTHKMSVLSKISMEVRPSAFTSLCKVVAGEQELWRHLGWFFTVLNFHSSLNRLCKGNSIAWSTRFLISDLASKVLSTYTSPVKMLWKFVVWNTCIASVFFLERLSCLKCLVKSITLAKLAAFISVTLDLSKINIIFLAILWVHFMVFLKLAWVCLPAKIWCINQFNQFISVIVWLVIMMRIWSMVSCV